MLNIYNFILAFLSSEKILIISYKNRLIHISFSMINYHMIFLKIVFSNINNKYFKKCDYISWSLVDSIHCYFEFIRLSS